MRNMRKNKTTVTSKKKGSVVYLIHRVLRDLDKDDRRESY